ncbi:hypothetical protein ColTof4_10197 [Colletotrichum tofieldiae]|nr:hypothetical protein ColTof3_06139 [Colletotrichum tofieldiae]GKT77774.1 hypothetical protein ColTof4_10197 [Colletotrichum tofieldiae]
MPPARLRLLTQLETMTGRKSASPLGTSGHSWTLSEDPPPPPAAVLGTIFDEAEDDRARHRRPSRSPTAVARDQGEPVQV